MLNVDEDFVQIGDLFLAETGTYFLIISEIMRSPEGPFVLVMTNKDLFTTVFQNVHMNIGIRRSHWINDRTWRVQ